MADTPLLYQPFKLKNVTFRNRTVVAPMCQYSANNGMVTDWHKVHYGQFALGGFGACIMEAGAVMANGRISHGDIGIWSDDHAKAMGPIVSFMKQNGMVAGIQLAHAGRKACVQRPWLGAGPLGKADFARGDAPWQPIGASQIPAGDGWLMPRKMNQPDIEEVIAAFVAGAIRANETGFDFIEIHGAHGYLIQSFLSPLSNTRDDEYGGNLQNRMRLALEVTKAVRAVWPQEKPLFFRISSVDGFEGGWEIKDSVVLAKELKKLGVDVIDCSAGGNSSKSMTANTKGQFKNFQVPYAAQVKREADILTQAVGIIVDGPQAEQILQNGEADLIAIGREALVDPYWPVHQARAMGIDEKYLNWPQQYNFSLQRRVKV